MQATLQIQFTPKRQRGTSCWYVNSGNTSDWIRAVVEGYAAKHHDSLRLLPLPTAADDRSPIGAILLSKQTPSHAPTSACLPYGEAASRVLLPIEAKFDPAITAAELEAELSAEQTYVWHPVVGLVAFEAADQLTLAHLLTAAPLTTATFDRGEPGTRLPNTLASIVPAIPPDMKLVMEDGRDGIGTKGKDLNQLPKPEGEPQPGMGNSLGRMGLSVFDAGLNLASAAGPFVERMFGPAGPGAGSGSGETWLSQWKQWTQQRLDQLNQATLSQRDKEINRLMNLLEQNPDEGLKWALPIGGDAHRGLASPSSHLSQRNPYFSLGGIGAGGPADHWDLSYQRQQELQRKYRELANREIGLGRYRRAAYIYAELLADIEAAANVLKQGQHWREAAVLYQERLKRPLDAAECLEQGGLCSEAIELYLEHKRYLKAGDLYVQLQQQDEADKCFELAVSECRSRRDALGAAKILEEKLASVPRAIDALDDGWPHSDQASQCLEQLFLLFKRHSMHDSAKKKISELRTHYAPPQRQASLVDVLADNATKYTDREVQNLAADACRVVAAKNLSTSRIVDRHRILQAIKRLEPDDRLLARDCLRFAKQETPLRKISPTTNLTIDPQLDRTIKIRETTAQWRPAATVTSANVIFHMMHLPEERRARIYRIAWQDGSQDFLEFQTGPHSDGNVPYLTADPNRPNDIYISRQNSKKLPLPLESFPLTNEIPFETKIVDTGFVVMGTAIATHSEIWRLLHIKGDVYLDGFTRNGNLVGSMLVGSYADEIEPWLPEDGSSIPMWASSKHIYIGLGTLLRINDQGDSWREVEFDSNIIRLTGSFPNTRSRLLISLEQGAMIYWDDNYDGRDVAFARDMERPYLAFTRSGHVVAASGKKCQILATRNDKIELIGEIDLPSEAYGLVTGNAPEEFGIVQEYGSIAIYSWKKHSH